MEGKQVEIERDGKSKLQLTGQQPNANTHPPSNAATESFLLQSQHYPTSHATAAQPVPDAEA
jgi:hypothetical protein